MSTVAKKQRRESGEPLPRTFRPYIRFILSKTRLSGTVVLTSLTHMHDICFSCFMYVLCSVLSFASSGGSLISSIDRGLFNLSSFSSRR